MRVSGHLYGACHSKLFDYSFLVLNEKWRFWLPLGLMMVVFAITRWPGLMPQNFSAAYAMAFCAGVYFPPRTRWWVPLGTFFVLDLLLNIFYYHVPAFDGYTLFKLGAFALIIWLGSLFTPKRSWLSLVSGGLFGALIFYLVTNIASWIFDPGYPKTLSGLIQALTTGLPGYPPTWTFLKNTLLSGGLFTGLFSGAMKMSEAAEEATEEEEEPGEDAVPEEA
jgi:hypothetical protein